MNTNKNKNEDICTSGKIGEIAEVNLKVSEKCEVTGQRSPGAGRVVEPRARQAEMEDLWQLSSKRDAAPLKAMMTSRLNKNTDVGFMCVQCSQMHRGGA